jgi:hypothetical protein
MNLPFLITKACVYTATFGLIILSQHNFEEKHQYFLWCHWEPVDIEAYACIHTQICGRRLSMHDSHKQKQPNHHGGMNA